MQLPHPSQSLQLTKGGLGDYGGQVAAAVLGALLMVCSSSGVELTEEQAEHMPDFGDPKVSAAPHCTLTTIEIVVNWCLVHRQLRPNVALMFTRLQRWLRLPPVLSGERRLLPGSSAAPAARAL